MVSLLEVLGINQTHKRKAFFYILAPYSWKRPCCGRENSFGKASSFQGKRWRGKVISDKTLSELGIHVRFWNTVWSLDMSNHRRTEDVPFKHEFLFTKYENPIMFRLMKFRNHGGSEILSEVWIWAIIKELKMFPHKKHKFLFLGKILVRFWRLPILQVEKSIHFLFSPLSFLATKSKEFIGKVSLLFTLWSSISELHLSL